jgi:hypothetical protein
MHSLYLLSFLLTGDKDKAEQCFIGGLGECLEGMGAFMEWARLWARRAIIRQAIRMIKPAPEATDQSPLVRVETAAIPSPNNNILAAIVSLCAFERFVFVMSILERLSDGDCLSFLRCSRRERSFCSMATESPWCVGFGSSRSTRLSSLHNGATEMLQVRTRQQNESIARVSLKGADNLTPADLRPRNNRLVPLVTPVQRYQTKRSIA